MIILWKYIWGVVILFSLTSFTYMSFKIIIKGVRELKSMINDLKKSL